eukprot:scaffold5143_cov52-Attheya_sp.AAC.1
MPIDEFGRQVPSGGGAGDGMNGAIMGQGVPESSSSGGTNTSSSRRYNNMDRHNEREGDHRPSSSSINSSTNNRRRSVSGSPPPATSRPRSLSKSSLEGGHNPHARLHPRSMSHDYNPHNDGRSGSSSRRRSYSPPSSSSAPPLNEGGHSRHHNHRDHHHRDHHHRDHTDTKNRSLFFSHPVSRYMDTPMLCQVLWDDEQQDKLDKIKDEDKSKSKDKTKDETVEPKLEEVTDEPASSSVTDEADVKQETADPTNPPRNKEEELTYDAYRSKYSLNYIRSFFNAHLDDSWFKKRYSPLDHKRAVLAERERAKAEALVMRQQALSSLQDLGESASTSTSTLASTSVCSFVVQARLGVGVKPTKASETHHHAHAQQQQQQQQQQHRVKRKYNSTDAAPELDMLDQRDDDNPLPRTHLHACVHADTTL